MSAPAPDRTPDLAARREALRGCALFRSLTAEELEALLARATLQRFARGDSMMRRGEAGTSMVVILQGSMRISVISADGQEISLGLLGPGDVVGELALLDGGERSSDVTAIEEGVIRAASHRSAGPTMRTVGS